MKQILLAAIVFLLFTLSAGAQQKGCGNFKKGQKKEFVKGLNLTAEQKTKAKQVNENYKAQMKALQSNDAITMGAYKAQKAALAEQKKKAFSNLLTQDQKNQIAAKKKQQQEKKIAKQDNKINKLKEKLNLSEQQMAGFNANRAKTKQQMEALKNNQTLTREQKKEQVIAMKKANKENFISNLNADQKKQLETLKNSKKQQHPMSK